MTGALLQRPTTLSLGSLGLLMECSQDHFTYDALDGQVGDESDGVVGGDTCDHDFLFLTWNSKKKKKGLHAAYDSFLFMGVRHTTTGGLFIDPYIFLLPVHGEIFFFLKILRRMYL